MSNTLLTPTQVIRKALMILHQKLAFVGTINRQYDDSFAKEGAKIGNLIKLRLPNKYTVGSSATVSPQATSESSVTLTMATQKNVAMDFLSSDLTLYIDDFSERILEPAMAVLAANIENDAFAMAQDVYYQEGSAGTQVADLITYLNASGRLTNSLAPLSNRSIQLPALDAVKLIDAVKGLFHDQQTISKQYREGIMGRTGGLDFYQNTLTPRMTNGNKVASVTVSGASQTGSSITLGGVANNDTFKKGQVFTMPGCYEVHPETKVSTGRLQSFVVTADTTATTTTVSVPISPTIVTSGATQNVSASPTDGGTLVFQGTASLTYGASLAYYKDAFAIAFADLYMPKGIDFGAREVMDGISLRIIRDFDVTNDKIITRVDAFYGYQTLRPELACRVASN